MARPIQAVIRVPRTGRRRTAPRRDSSARPPSIGRPGSRLNRARTTFSQVAKEAATESTVPCAAIAPRAPVAAASRPLLAGPARETSTDPIAGIRSARYCVCPPHRVSAMWSTLAPKARATSAWASSWTSTERMRNRPRPRATSALRPAERPRPCSEGNISTATSSTVTRVAGLTWSGGSAPILSIVRGMGPPRSRGGSPGQGEDSPCSCVPAQDGPAPARGADEPMMER